MGILDFFNKKENKDKYIKWLKKNAGERMDANRKELFKPDRCDFHLDRYEFASKYIKDGNKCASRPAHRAPPSRLYTLHGRGSQRSVPNSR